MDFYVSVWFSCNVVCVNVVVEKHVYNELQKHISSFSVQLLFIYLSEKVKGVGGETNEERWQKKDLYKSGWGKRFLSLMGNRPDPFIPWPNSQRKFLNTSHEPIQYFTVLTWRTQSQNSRIIRTQESFIYKSTRCTEGAGEVLCTTGWGRGSREIQGEARAIQTIHTHMTAGSLSNTRHSGMTLGRIQEVCRQGDVGKYKVQRNTPLNLLWLDVH